MTPLADVANTRQGCIWGLDPMNRRRSLEAKLISEEDLPDMSGDVESVLAEMEALQAFFDASLGHLNPERVMRIATYALHIRCEDKSLEDRLATFCLAHSLGEVRVDLIPHRWSRATRWTKRVAENLITAWMRWTLDGVTHSVEAALERMEDGREDHSIEALALQYWATAIQSLAYEDQMTSKRYFDRAMEVSSQWGLAVNPPICWTYAISFLPQKVFCV